MIIAIDGPAGSGKTTTAKKVAQKLDFIHINTGAMYRAITLKFISNDIDLSDKSIIESTLQNTRLDFLGNENNFLFLDGNNDSLEIHTNLVTEKVSLISNISAVRDKLVEYQRQMAAEKDVVLEGRDIGTVVFPNADFKFFLIADIKVRAERRSVEMKKNGENFSIKQIMRLLDERDINDISRANSPLIKAKDAIELDTTCLTIEEQVNYIINIVNQ